jgi:hypothetical protein
MELIRAIFRKMQLPPNTYMPKTATLKDKSITPEMTALSDGLSNAPAVNPAGPPP